MTMYTQQKPIENAHIVRERDRRRLRELLAVFSLGIPIGLFLLLFTWENLEVIRLGREATQLQEKRKELQDANKLLRSEIERLTSLEAVERKAIDLGLRSTESSRIVIVSSTPSPERAGTVGAEKVEEAPAPAGSLANLGNPSSANSQGIPR